MARAQNIQLNVRSEFAHRRANELARQTGMTATQVVEDALRGYLPPGAPMAMGALVRRGAILVRPRRGQPITQEEADAALEAVREGDV